MPSIRINKTNNEQPHFITCTIQKWYYIFDRHNRFEIIANSLKYCQKNKGLKIYAYVFMLNHIHLIVSAPNLSGFLCDFKKFTSNEIMKNIVATEPNILSLFPKKNGKTKFWQETNFPKLIETEKFLRQKQEYIQNNPVRKQYVTEPENWYWSSANLEQPLRISVL